MDLKETGWGDVDWIILAQATEKLQAFCAYGDEPSSYTNCGKFLDYMKNLVVSEEGIFCVYYYYYYYYNNINNNKTLSLLHTCLAVFKGVRVSMTNTSYSLFCQILSTVRRALSITALEYIQQGGD